MSNEAYKELQRVLLRARKRAQLSQAELASRLRRPQSFVSKYERGERRLDVIEFRQVALALGVDPVRLLRTLYEEIS